MLWVTMAALMGCSTGFEDERSTGADAVTEGTAESAPGRPAPGRPAPDILLISIDTLRADHLASYGYERDTAPTLSRIAREGAQCSRSWSQSSSTVPTHASMFTGLWPHQHRTFAYPKGLPPAAWTLVEHLGDQGYETVCLGSSTRFHAGSGFFQGCDVAETFESEDKNLRSALVNQRALDALGKRDRPPIFGFLHYFDAHEPYAPPEPWLSRWHPGLDSPRPEETSEFLQEHRAPERQLSPEMLDYLRGLYDGAISYQDVAIEALLEGLEDLGLSDDTLILITSDHGEEFKEHGGLSHAIRLHEELVRVPLLVRWPSRIAAGTVVERAVQTVDIFPTLIELAGLPMPEGLVGRSFADDLFGRPVGSRSEPTPRQNRIDRLEIVVHQQNANTWALSATLPRGRFKISVFQGQAPVLFGLDEDPLGLQPLGGGYEAETAELLKIASALGVGGKEGAVFEPQMGERDPEMVERLKAIGYVE